MERIEDERLLFFIEHAAQIRQWAALDGEVRDLADRFLTDMVQRWLEDEPLIDGALHKRSGGGQWPRYDLYRPSWVRDQIPLVTVSLEWHSRRVGLDPDSTPVIGSRVGSRADETGERREQLQRALAAHREATGGDSSKHWTAARRVPADLEDPGNLHRFETRLVEELTAEWQATAPHIDRLLGHAAET